MNVVAETIATNEKPKDWLNKIDFYISQPLISNDKMSEIYAISEEKGVDYKTAVIMYHSTKQI